VGRTAGGALTYLLASGLHNNPWTREIAEPQKLLPHLLHPNVSLLAPETVGAYIQAAVKLFGAWSMELSQDWDSGKTQGVQEVVDTLISRLKNFTSHSEIEVQERVRRMDVFFFGVSRRI
jgi:AP-3 complex subunit delta